MILKISKLHSTAVAAAAPTAEAPTENFVSSQETSSRKDEFFNIEYRLRHAPTSNDSFLMNSFVGKNVDIRWTESIFCSHCDSLTKKTFAQGYCYRCFSTLAQCDQCITRPELCHFHLGTCREPEWGKEHCMIPHTVYLTNTSHLKVGVTRRFQQQTRWIDQGASQSIVIGYTQTRRGAGRAESVLKKKISDQTSWQKMLRGNPPDLNLHDEQKMALTLIPLGLDFAPELKPVVSHFIYPVQTFPTVVKPLDLEKTPRITTKLLGIKGQYLLTESGVLNMRKHVGFEVEVNFL